MPAVDLLNFCNRQIQEEEGAGEVGVGKDI